MKMNNNEIPNPGRRSFLVRAAGKAAEATAVGGLVTALDSVRRSAPPESRQAGELLELARSVHPDAGERGALFSQALRMQERAQAGDMRKAGAIGGGSVLLGALLVGRALDWIKGRGPGL